MRPKNYSSGWGVLARGTQPEPPTKLIGADKAQNDRRLVPDVGYPLAGGISQEPLI